MTRRSSTLAAGAALGLIVLATLLVGVPRASAEPGASVADVLPVEYRDRGRAVVAERDAERRAAELRELAIELGPGATAFLIPFLESDPAPAVRERAARSLRGLREPAALDALERAVATDPDVGVVLRCLEELHTIRSARMLELIRARLARSPAGGETPPEQRGELLRAEEHWLTVARGGLLPVFLREAPPVFRVLPADRSVRLVAFGDFGSGDPDQLRTAEALARLHAERPFDLGITLGDNFYPRGVAGLDDPLWQKAWIAPYAGLGIPFYASLGNHDWGLPESPAAEILYDAPASNWNLPAARYTFTAGPAQLFALDTTALSRAQIEWLDRELDRSTAPWKIVYGHHPIRSHGRYGDNAELVESLLPVLRNRVDLYLAGHEHDLQVLSPEDGVHFVVAGGGGKSIRETEPGPRTLFSASAFGFATLDVSPERVVLRMIERDRGVVFESSIEREAGRAAAPTQGARSR